MNIRRTKKQGFEEEFELVLWIVVVILKHVKERRFEISLLC